MFLRNIFSRQSQMEIPQDNAAPEKQMSQEDEKTSRTYMNVHIWQTDGAEGRCGHSSVSLHREQNGQKTKEYGGMWPDSKNIFLLSHPFAYLLASVKGEVHHGRKFCEEREGEELPMKPDRVYTIELTDDKYGELKSKMAKDKEDIEQGRVLYSLFPRVNMISLLRLSANEGFMRGLMDPDFLEAYPEILESAAEVRKIRSEHCTTFVKPYVEMAGYEIGESPTPWMISPIGLDVSLAELSKRHPDKISQKVNIQPKKEFSFLDKISE